jgi:hypothetical protein
MFGRAALLAGLAAGYVLGARDGRERFEQIKARATTVARDPRVQDKAAKVTEAARAKAPGLTDAVAGKVSRAVGGSDGSTGTPTATSPMTATVPAQPAGTLDALDEDVVVLTPAATTVDGGRDV